MPYLKHGDWSLRQPKSVVPHPVTANGGKVSLVVAHHSVTPASPFVDMLRLVERIHHNGIYSDFAYNGAISNETPEWTNGRGPKVQGGATGNGMDRSSLSVVAIGDFHTAGKDRASDMLVSNFLELLRRWQRQGYLADRITIDPHRKHYATACCGDRFVRRLKEVEDAYNGNTPIGGTDVLAFENWRSHYNGIVHGSMADGVVEFVQHRLAQFGYLPFDGVDGVKGPQTDAAVAAWERDHGFNGDENFGRPSWEGFTAVRTVSVEVPVEHNHGLEIDRLKEAREAIAAVEFVLRSE